MESFTIEIAGVVFRVHPLFQSTREYCKPYLSEQNPDFIVEVTSDDLICEQAALDREAIDEGLKLRKFKEPFLERSVIQRRVADFLISRNTLMLHGSTVAVDGRAYLFTAPCGTGKSTHTRLWREAFGNRAIMVNDDKPCLQITPGGVLAYGSPWSGKHGLATNVCVPLKGICLLRRGKANAITRAEAADLKVFLCNQIHLSDNEALGNKALSLMDALVELVPLWEMSCNKDLEAAEISYSAMSCE